MNTVQWGVGVGAAADGMVDVCESEHQARTVVELGTLGMDTVYRHVRDVLCACGAVVSLWCAEEHYADVSGLVAAWLAEDMDGLPSVADVDEAADVFSCTVLDADV